MSSAKSYSLTSTAGSSQRLVNEWQAKQHPRQVQEKQARAAAQQHAEQECMDEDRQEIEEAKALLPPDALE